MARTLNVAQAYTYAAIMPVDYAISRVEMIADTALEIARSMDDQVLWWAGYADDGELVGVASAKSGPSWWEAEHPAPSVDWHLDKLYALPRAHGSGVGQALLDLAAPPDVGTYLWILHDNPRAEAFYRRNGFRPDGFTASCGPDWFDRPMFRMVREGRMAH